MKTHILNTIDFRAAGNADRFLISGWSVAEQDGCWSTDDISTIIFERPETPFGYVLEMDLSPAINPPFCPAQTLRVICNGRRITDFMVDRAGLFACVVPPGPPGESRLIISFEHPCHFRWIDTGKGRDKRNLAIKFRRLRVLGLLEPWRTVQRPAAASNISSIREREIISEFEGITKLSLADGLSNFEVLAGNCDMGIALREIGYEWLSLLRFAGATPAVAIRGLETDFDRVGTKISAEIADNPMKEWMVKDEFGFRFHSGQSSIEVEEGDLLAKFPIYAGRLRRKLLEDLDASEKIFVFADHRDLNVGRSLEYVLPLYLALRRRSSSSLLWVCPARNDPSLKGSVVEILPGLAMADLDITAPPVLVGGGITITGWVNVLCNALNALKPNHNGALPADRHDFT